jgi:hypothetical protein
MLKPAAFQVHATGSAAWVGQSTANAAFQVQATGSAAWVGQSTANAAFQVHATGSAAWKPPTIVAAAFQVDATGSAAWKPPTIVAAAFQVDATGSAVWVGEAATKQATIHQYNYGSGVLTANTSSVNWTVPTTIGSCLIYTIKTLISTTITPPAGWILADSLNGGSTVGEVYVYYYPNAPSHSGGEAFVLGSSASSWAVEMFEVFGIDTVSPLDKVVHNTSSTSTTPIDSGTTALTSDKYEWCFCSMLETNFSAPMGFNAGWTFATGTYQAFHGGLAASFAASKDQIVKTTEQCTLSITASPWVSVLCTFKLA